MKHVLPVLVVLLFATSCRMLKISDFHRDAPTPEPLPRLGLEVHAESFALLFGKEMLERVLIGNAIQPGSYIPTPVGVLTQVGQPVHDVFVLLGNELNDNIIRNDGPQQGKARFKLAYYNRYNTGWGYTIPSVLTLGMANVFGLPAGVTRADVELQMEIMDNEGNILARYRAPGTGKTKVAMYYGYSGYGAMRKANLLALQDALQGIKRRLTTDLPQLQSRLVPAEKPTR